LIALHEIHLAIHHATHHIEIEEIEMVARLDRQMILEVTVEQEENHHLETHHHLAEVEVEEVEMIHQTHLENR